MRALQPCKSNSKFMIPFVCFHQKVTTINYFLGWCILLKRCVWKKKMSNIGKGLWISYKNTNWRGQHYIDLWQSNKINKNKRGWKTESKTRRKRKKMRRGEKKRKVKKRRKKRRKKRKKEKGKCKKTSKLWNSNWKISEDAQMASTPINIYLSSAILLSCYRGRAMIDHY